MNNDNDGMDTIMDNGKLSTNKLMWNGSANMGKVCMK